MRGPTGTERLADMGIAELMGGCFLEGWSREVWWRVDFEPHPFVAGSTGFNDLAVAVLVAG